MSDTVRKRGFLLALAAEAIVPALTGECSGRALDRFGPLIVDRWRDWMRNQPPGIQRSVLNELGELPPDRARVELTVALDRLASGLNTSDRATGLEYLAAIPRAAQRSLVLDHNTGARVLPRHQSPIDLETLLSLLPLHVPPYPPGSA